jgi:transcriptional regulator with XRE-family HTH domain
MAQRELTGPGVSHAYVSRIEADLRTPSVKAIRKIAAKLGVSPYYLERGLEVDAAEERELRLLDGELAFRLEGDAAGTELILSEIGAEAIADGDRAGLVRVQIALGNVALARGDHRQALSHYEHALKLKELSPASDQQLFANTADCYRAAGMADRAASFLRGALERLDRETPGEGRLRARFEIALGLTLLELGQDAEAGALLEHADRSMQTESDPARTARALWVRARSATRAEQHRVALSELRKALILLETADEDRELANSRALLAEALSARRKTD